MLSTLALIGPEEGLIVLVAVLVLFGGKKIPELMRGVGQGIGELKKGLEEGQRSLTDAARPVEAAPRLDQRHLDESPKAPLSAAAPAPEAEPEATHPTKAE